MHAALARLAYEAGLRTLGKQEELLGEVRARTGILLAASSLAASFLGAPALERSEDVLLGLALLAFVASIGSSLYVLMPNRSLIFSTSGRALYEGLYEFGGEIDEVYRRLAYQLDRFWDANERVLARIFLAYRIAVGALGAEIALLVAAVSGTLF